MRTKLSSVTVIDLGLAFSRYSTTAETDFTAIKVCSLAKNLAYALQEAKDHGSLESPSESFRQNLDMTHRLLKQLDAWTADYMNAGKNKGRLVSLCDYFYAGSNLDVLKKTSEDLDQAVKAMGLVVKMDMCACVKDIIEQQSGIAKDVVEALKQHTGGQDDGLLAAKLAMMTNIAVASVQRELTTSMAVLRRVENRLQYVRDVIIHDLGRKMGNMKIVASVDPGAACLELAPFSKLEWVNELQGKLGLGVKWPKWEIRV